MFLTSHSVKEKNGEIFVLPPPAAGASGNRDAAMA